MAAAFRSTANVTATPTMIPSATPTTTPTVGTLSSGVIWRKYYFAGPQRKSLP